jgi:hypothetical protein
MSLLGVGNQLTVAWYTKVRTWRSYMVGSEMPANGADQVVTGDEQNLVVEGDGAEKTARRQRSIWTTALVLSTLVWFVACFIGFKALFDYGQAPGPLAQLPIQWPADSKLQIKPNRPTLVMFVHPKCPCTRASIGELAEFMAHAPKHLTVYVVFLLPNGYAEDWAKSDLWQSAAAILGVQCVFDRDGSETRRFHANTSGQVATYDAAGHLLFSGGLTPSRGHFGDSRGMDLALASVSCPASKLSNSAVFGCPLFAPDLRSQTIEHAN